LQQQSSDRVTIQRWNLQRDLGMSCGGEAEVLFEMSWPLQAPVVIFGAGHVAQKLVPLLGLLDATVWVVDPRKEWLEKLPITQRKLKTFCVEKYEDFVPQVPPTASVLALTQGHSTDLPVLVEILKRRLPPYVGAIGSSVKASKLKNDLRLSGVPELHIEKLHCPIGLDLGNTQHPGEIALSIAAQWLKDRKSEKYIYAHYAHQNPEPL
jgi:xanthine dehydrogenase accessory factor